MALQKQPHEVLRRNQEELQRRSTPLSLSLVSFLSSSDSFPQKLFCPDVWTLVLSEISTLKCYDLVLSHFLDPHTCIVLTQNNLMAWHASLVLRIIFAHHTWHTFSLENFLCCILFIVTCLMCQNIRRETRIVATAAAILLVAKASGTPS